jgi:hypothetical protein
MITKLNLELTENQVFTLLDLIGQDGFKTGQMLGDNQVLDIVQIYDKLIRLKNTFKRNKEVMK